MNTSTLEGLLGMIVFGLHADTPEGMQYTAIRLRQAAALLEYRYAVERRFDAEQAQAKADRGEPLAPKPKRNRGRPAKAANGQAPHDPPPGFADPLFQTADSAATP